MSKNVITSERIAAAQAAPFGKKHVGTRPKQRYSESMVEKNV